MIWNGIQLLEYKIHYLSDWILIQDSIVKGFTFLVI